MVATRLEGILNIQNRMEDRVRANTITTNEKVRMKGTARLISYIFTPVVITTGGVSVLYDTIVGYTKGYVGIWAGMDNSIVLGIITFMVGLAISGIILWLVWDDIVELIKINKSEGN